jgi:hypothetical protein
MKSIQELIIDESKDHAIDTAECPYCFGLFGVDCSYLDQVTNTVHCPMCGNEVVFEEWE